MAASVFDSALFSRLFPTGEAGRLFTDSAEIRAMLLVEGALARAQGELGLIPEPSALYIHRAAMEVQIDPAALAEATGQNGVCVPGLVAAFRAAVEAPEHAQYIHWGATSQDIIDTGLMLRLRQLLEQCEGTLRAVLQSLATLAEDHAETPMAARTWGQVATPTSFGAHAAHWGAPLLELLEEMPPLRQGALWVSLSGAAGTAGALGPQAPELRAKLAEALRLHDPARSWHSDRTPILRIAGWITRCCAALGKMGEDLTLLAQSGIAEAAPGGGGASSTMPQKQNPVTPGALTALARQAASLSPALSGAALHRQERDGAAWFTEWLTLPQLCLSGASALLLARDLTRAITPDPARMAATLGATGGLVHAEALSFRLAQTMPRPDAQAAVKALCIEAGHSGTPLADLAARDFPDADLTGIFDTRAQLGQAPTEARAFASTVRAL
ncbi:MAG: adenylosuccinate lyase family protein [Sediminimonas qiaohouensis]|uniref:Adenylosuccinate lyase family protein n=1 Tax=Sediminimonas qiaohouensis TaxID=552061 RepID=A0A7C9HN70_9RHOB|nr:lyase family protein [Sediminimonas qiaohouensis]MTJ04863.1 adenylosuccinate lyase family protein [Sediminimonas qiaohouensis]